MSMYFVVAPPIDKNSWLMQKRYSAFRDRYHYAASQTAAIKVLSKLTPEETYHLWSALDRAPDCTKK